MLSEFNQNALKILSKIQASIGHSKVYCFYEGTNRIIIKRENHNPSGSIKDKAAIQMVKNAILNNRLSKKSILCDASSGNFGVSLSWLAQSLGLSASIIYPQQGSKFKSVKITHYGGKLNFFNKEAPVGSMNSFENVSEVVRKQEFVFNFDQMRDPSNPKAYYIMGTELLKLSERPIDFVFSGIGTGGTISGIGRFIKEKKSSIKVIGVDSVGSIYHQEFYNLPNQFVRPDLLGVPGIGDVQVSNVFSKEVIDNIEVVSVDEAFSVWKNLIEKEMDVGPSTGLAVAGWKQHMKKYKINFSTSIIISPDSSKDYGE